MPEINIIVKARDEASKVLGNVAGSMESLEDNARKALLPLGAISGIGTAIIGKMTMTAARTEELGVVIENLGRVSGYSQEELAEVEESITNLGITTQGARTIMSRFMGAELDLADASKIARAAQDLAVIGMQDSSEAAETLTSSGCCSRQRGSGIDRSREAPGDAQRRAGTSGQLYRNL